MGTRHEDQPAEHWAGPESLDPTPVWKQYALVALLLVVGLVVLVIVAVAALAPQLATPPALVPGDRLVLAASDVPAVGARPRLVASPVIDDARSFYLVQPRKGDVLALRAHWARRPGEPECRVAVLAVREGAELGAIDCPVFRPESATFDLLGNPATPGAIRGLDQYLVSVSGDRVIVNLSRVIRADERTSAPVPTGIPQPQQTP
ncbi:MAG TPA: hypothetical protein VFV20_10735 [Candidatus Limnocylindria bacterium]|nr:hypothetical protein [Candidatus Limnocylindria bacterium]